MRFLIGIVDLIAIGLAVGISIKLLVRAWRRKSFGALFLGIIAWVVVYVITALGWPLLTVWAQDNNPGRFWWNDPWDAWGRFLVPDIWMFLGTLAAIVLAALGRLVPVVGRFFRFLARLLAALLLIVAILAIDLLDPFRLMFPAKAKEPEVYVRTCLDLYSALRGKLDAALPSRLSPRERELRRKQLSDEVILLQQLIKGEKLSPDATPGCGKGAPNGTLTVTEAGNCGLDIRWQVTNIVDPYDENKEFGSKYVTVEFLPKDVDAGELVFEKSTGTYTYLTGGQKYPQVQLVDMVGNPPTIKKTSTVNLTECEPGQR